MQPLQRQYKSPVHVRRKSNVTGQHKSPATLILPLGVIKIGNMHWSARDRKATFEFW